MKANKFNTMLEFVVEGSRRFPVDMLRYDSCFPASQDSAVELSCSMTWHGTETSHRVVLRSYKEGDATVGRWKSFGWNVTYSRRIALA